MDALDTFSDNFSKYLSNKAMENRSPLSGTFELLPFCNMKCNMCYIVHENETHYRNAMKDINFWDRAFDEAIENGMLYALITGGEPFIYPQIRELLERINKKPIHLAINTNGTLLDERTVEWLKKVYPGRLNISLYGGSNETYNKVCKNPKGFEQVIRAFHLLNEYKIPYRVHSTLTPDNIHDFDKIIEICNQFEAPLQMTYYMFPPFRKEKGNILNEGRFSPEDAAAAALKVLKSRISNKYELYQRLKLQCACFEEPSIYGAYGSNDVLCRGGYASFWINWKGQISGCGIHDAEHIDLETTSFSDAWKTIVTSTEKQKLSEECKYCKYRCICPTCVAAAYCETGHTTGVPIYLCKFSKEFAKLMIKELERLQKEYE